MKHSKNNTIHIISIIIGQYDNNMTELRLFGRIYKCK